MEPGPPAHQASALPLSRACSPLHLFSSNSTDSHFLCRPCLRTVQRSVDKLLSVRAEVATSASPPRASLRVPERFPMTREDSMGRGTDRPRTVPHTDTPHTAHNTGRTGVLSLVLSMCPKSWVILHFLKAPQSMHVRARCQGRLLTLPVRNRAQCFLLDCESRQT